MVRFAAFLLAGFAVLVPAFAQTVPAEPPKDFDARREGVKPGQVEFIEYDSKITGRRKAVVYLPPGFSKETKYPVLYLLHGAGDDETGWLKKGAADAILNNLYADKKAVPMIVVMPNGFAPSRDGKSRSAGLEQDILEVLSTYVQNRYPVKYGRENTAIAGLSMGGTQSFNIGLKHRDRFAWVGVFSTNPRPENAADLLEHPDAEGKKLRLFWLSCGDEDKVLDANKKFHATLEEKKIAHVWRVDKGGHTWPVWKTDLYLIAQLLFRD